MKPYMMNSKESVYAWTLRIIAEAQSASAKDEAKK